MTLYIVYLCTLVLHNLEESTNNPYKILNVTFTILIGAMNGLPLILGFRTRRMYLSYVFCQG